MEKYFEWIIFNVIIISVSLSLWLFLADDHDALEKRRSVTMDSPEIAKDSDKSEDDKTKKGRSKTVGDIEGSVTSPVKVHVPTIFKKETQHSSC